MQIHVPTISFLSFSVHSRFPLPPRSTILPTIPISSGFRLEFLWVHVDLTQARHAPAELEQRLHALEDLHVREADLADELELGVLAERGDGLGDLEHGADDVVARVAEAPEVLERVQGAVDVALVAGLEHGLDLDGVRRVDDLENVVAADEAEAGVRALQVVDGLAHVALGAEDERGHALVVVLDLLGLDDLQ